MGIVERPARRLSIVCFLIGSRSARPLLPARYLGIAHTLLGVMCARTLARASMPPANLDSKYLVGAVLPRSKYLLTYHSYTYLL